MYLPKHTYLRGHQFMSERHWCQRKGWKLDPIKSIRLQLGECMVSYDVKVLFTSVLVDPAISIVKNKLQQDPLLSKRTSMSITQIITLLEFCHKNTYILFQGKYFLQVQGTAMGFPINLLIANLFMEEFEPKAISSAPNLPRFWLRYIDDTFVNQQAEHSHQFLQLINSIDSHIQFTM